MAGLRSTQGTPEVDESTRPLAHSTPHTTSSPSAPASGQRAVVIRHSRGKRPHHGRYRPKGGNSVPLSVPPNDVPNADAFLQHPGSAADQYTSGGVGVRPSPSEGYHSAPGAGIGPQPSALPHVSRNYPASQVGDSGSSSGSAPGSRILQSGRPFRPPPSVVPSDSDSEEFQGFSEGEEDTYSFDHDTVDPSQEDAQLTFTQALSKLQVICPGLFCQLETAPAAPISATSAAILGSSSPAPVLLSALLESSTVTNAVNEALAMARGSPALAPDPQLEYPGGFKCGKYIRPSSLPRGSRLGSRQLISRSAVPECSLPANQEDALVSSAGSPSVSLPDKVVADNEEFARRALDACTVLDSFVAGLLTAIKDPDQPGFCVAPDADGKSVLAFAGAIDSIFRFMARSLSQLHLNQVMARRDALLTSSQVITAPQTRTSLRLAPLSSSSLFGGRVQQVLHRQAEAQRDLAFSFPPRRAPAPQPRKRPGFRSPSGPRQKAPRPSFGQRSYSAPRLPAPRPPRQATHKRQPARRPPPPSQGAASRVHPQ